MSGPEPNWERTCEACGAPDDWDALVYQIETLKRENAELRVRPGMSGGKTMAGELTLDEAMAAARQPEEGEQ